MTENTLTFDDIRPYRDYEVKEALSKLLQDEKFDKILMILFKSDEQVQLIKQQLATIDTIDKFQLQFIAPLVDQLRKSSTTSLTLSGLENIDKDKKYLFISNHRDIIMDPSLFNTLLTQNGVQTTEIAIGSNLLIYPWIEILVRTNKSFKVLRDIPPKQLMVASKNMSAYMREQLTKGHSSVWLAQKEGRAKNGMDKTQASLLKMVNLSNSGSAIEGFKELNVVPLSISYEIEPVGDQKVAETLNKKYVDGFKKSAQDDMIGMGQGIKDQKGNVTFHIGKPLDLSTIDPTFNRNKQINAIADMIDNQIWTNYSLWPNNFIGYDQLNSCNKYSARYTQEELESYKSLRSDRLGAIIKDEQMEEAISLWDQIYAGPIVSREENNIEI